MKIATMLALSAVTFAASTHLAAQVTPGPALEFIPMLEQETSIPAHTDIVLAQKSFNLQEGESRRVFGRVEITSTHNNKADVEAKTVCVGPDGTNSDVGDAEQNYQGPSTPIGPSYPTPGHLVFYPLLLLVAPTTGTYVCQLRASTDTAVVAVGRSFQGDNTTWLRVSAADEANAFWLQGANCNEYGNNPTCTYLNEAPDPTQTYVFENGQSPSNLWLAQGSFVDVKASLMVTTCYNGTGSCVSKYQGGWCWQNWGPCNSGSVVESHLELVQLDPKGSECNLTSSPDQVTTVGNHPHHYMIYYEVLTVPLYPCGESRQFKIRIFVKWLSGNPVKIDGYTYTHAVAINSFYGTAPPVPKVGGLTESAASNTLSASGYFVSVVSPPEGSVVSQTPSAGTIELPGSGVDLTLSGQ